MLPTCQSDKASRPWLATVACAVLLLGFALPAGAAESPQWTVTSRSDVPPAESTFLRTQRSWDALPDGGAVVFSFDSYAYYVRNFDAEGRVRNVARGSFAGAGVRNNQLSSAIVRRHPDGGAFALFGDGTNCALVRVDARGAILWKRLPAQNLPYASACRDLHVLPDGSALVLRQSALVRVDGDGNSIWTIRNGDASRYFAGNAMSVDGNGVIWVASSGGVIGGGNLAAVLRFRFDGARLSEDFFLCGACISNVSRGVALMSGGDAMVVGGGNTGGFAARYAPDGTRRYLTFGEPNLSYDEVVVDGHDRVFVRSESPAYSLRRLDPGNGNVLWTRPGETLAPLPDGVATTLAEGQNNSRQTAVAYDADGNRVWTRALARGNFERIAAPLADAGGVSLLLLSWPADPLCGRSPALVRLDSTGVVVGVRKACATPGSTIGRALHAVPGVGVLSDLQSGLVVHTHSGSETWRLPVCDGCNPFASGTVHHTPAKLRSDGGAWVVRGVVETSYEPTAKAVERLDASGRVVASAPLMATGIANTSVVLVDTPDHAWVLLPQSGRLGWQRVANDGAVLAMGSVVLPVDANYVWVRDAKPNPDGGFTVAVQHISGGCFLGCPPVYSVVLRTRTGGTAAWRYEPSQVNGALVVDADGGAWHVYVETVSSSRMEHIGADGVVGVPIALPGVSGSELTLAGPFRNRMFIAPTNALFGVDTDGGNLIERPGQMELLGAHAAGVLIRDYSRPDLEAQWLDSATLRTLIEFDLPSSTDAFAYYSGSWSIPDGTTVYGIKGVLGEDDLTRATLMRFDIARPGADLLFANGFD